MALDLTTKDKVAKEAPDAQTPLPGEESAAAKEAAREAAKHKVAKDAPSAQSGQASSAQTPLPWKEAALAARDRAEARVWQGLAVLSFVGLVALFGPWCYSACTGRLAIFNGARILTDNPLMPTFQNEREKEQGEYALWARYHPLDRQEEVFELHAGTSAHGDPKHYACAQLLHRSLFETESKEPLHLQGGEFAEPLTRRFVAATTVLYGSRKLYWDLPFARAAFIDLAKTAVLPSEVVSQLSRPSRVTYDHINNFVPRRSSYEETPSVVLFVAGLQDEKSPLESLFDLQLVHLLKKARLVILGGNSDPLRNCVAPFNFHLDLFPRLCGAPRCRLVAPFLP